MPEPINLPIVTDRDALADIGYEFMESRVPGWSRYRADAASQIIATNARITGEARDVASDVPLAILRYLGRWVVQLPPLEASSASATATVTAVDTLGHTIAEGTRFEVLTTGDDSVVFLAADTVVIPPTSSSTGAGEVVLIAESPGAEASGLPITLDARPVDTIAWIDTVTLATPSTGGADAETDEQYLARLVEEFQLFTPRPILPHDFAVLARRVNGVGRSLAINLYAPSARVNEKDSLAITGGTPASGSFKIAFTAPFTETSGTVAYNATAANVVTALEAMSNIRKGDVAATGGPLPGTPVVIEFKGSYAGTPISLSVTNSTLSAGTAAFTETVTSVTGYAQERTVTVAVTDDNGLALSGATKTEIDDLLTAMREVNFVVHVVDATYTTIDVTFTAVAYSGFDAASVESAAEAAVADYLNPRNWGTLPGQDPTDDWTDETTVRYLEIAEVINRVEGVHYVSSLTLARTGDTMESVDVPLPGPAALPLSGTINGTVSAP